MPTKSNSDGCGRTILVASVCVCVGLVVTVCGHAVVGQERRSAKRQVIPPPHPKRVRTPDWSKADTAAIFFEDAFHEALVGERPSRLSGKTSAKTNADSAAITVPAGKMPAGENTSVTASEPDWEADWASIVSRETIEDEIKRLSRQLKSTVSQPASFAGGGYRKARQHFSVLAALFAIVHEYDGPIRWKESAKAARDKFAHGASIANVGTKQVFNVAKSYKSELTDLIRGDGIVDGNIVEGNIVEGSIVEGDEQHVWTELVSRNALMQRLEYSHQSVLEPALASEKEMARQAEAAIHESELTAALARVLVQNGMEACDDAQYAQYCADLERGAAEVTQSVQRNDYEAAVKSSGGISKSCSNCHEAYRG